MRNDVKLVRGLAVAMISVFLMAGVAFATDSGPGSSEQQAPAAVSPTGAPECHCAERE